MTKPIEELTNEDVGIINNVNPFIADHKDVVKIGKRSYTKRKKNTPSEKAAKDELAELKQLILTVAQKVNELAAPKNDIPPANEQTEQSQKPITTQILRAAPEEGEEKVEPTRPMNRVRRAISSGEHIGNTEAIRRPINLGNRPNEFEKIIKDSRFRLEAEKEHKAGKVEPKYVVPPTPRKGEPDLVQIECMSCHCIDTIPLNLVPPGNRYKCSNCIPRGTR